MLYNDKQRDGFKESLQKDDSLKLFEYNQSYGNVCNMQHSSSLGGYLRNHSCGGKGYRCLLSKKHGPKLAAKASWRAARRQVSCTHVHTHARTVSGMHAPRCHHTSTYRANHHLPCISLQFTCHDPLFVQFTMSDHSPTGRDKLKGSRDFAGLSTLNERWKMLAE